MKRWLVRICGLLLLGAIVNVAVAWTVALLISDRIQQGKWREMHIEEAQAYWGRHAPPSWHGAAVAVGNSLESWVFGFRHTQVFAYKRLDPFRDDIPPSLKMYAVGDDAAGWPLVSMLFRSRYMTDASAQVVEVEGGWQMPSASPGSKVAPLLAIWSGFAINTVFYAGVLWLLFAAPFALRRRRRIKRGLCPKCAYPVGQSDVCTECGKPVTRRSVEPASS